MTLCCRQASKCWAELVSGCDVLSFTQYPSASRKLSALHFATQSHLQHTLYTLPQCLRTNFQKPVSIMVDSIGDTARKASAGTWRKPRVRIYDYNNVSYLQMSNVSKCIQLYSQDLGSNYYQPMIKYINQKDIYGPFMEKKRVEMPDRPEVSSNKYSNM